MLSPRPHFNFVQEHEGQICPNRQDWFLTNLFLLLGLCSVAFLTSLNIAFDTFYGMHGIRNFLHKLPWLKQLQFYVATWTTIFGSLASCVTCCIFYAITRDLVRHIEYTEKAILERARNKYDFHSFHRSLHQYTKNVIASCRQWFAVHSFFFIVLVFALIAEWLKLGKHRKVEEKYFYYLLITQIAGSLMVAFKFAFPFIAASRVTSKFSTFYYNIAMNCQIDGLPDLFIFSRKSGFKLYGFRVNTAAAIMMFLSCFSGLLKTLYSFT